MLTLTTSTGCSCSTCLNWTSRPNGSAIAMLATGERSLQADQCWAMFSCFYNCVHTYGNMPPSGHYLCHIITTAVLPHLWYISYYPCALSFVFHCRVYKCCRNYVLFTSWYCNYLFILDILIDILHFINVLLISYLLMTHKARATSNL